MNTKKHLGIKLVHCGNKNITNPADNAQKNIFYMPMGLFALAARLREEGFDAEILHLDLEHGRPLEEILDFTGLDAIGFDCHWINQALGVIDTAVLVKQLKPSVFVFLGGFSASLFSEEIVRDHPEIDAVIRGDGEKPIVELCMYLERHRQCQTVPRDTGDFSPVEVSNLVWRDGQGQVQVNAFSYTAAGEDMDRLDFAAVDLLRNREYYQVLCQFWTRFSPLNTNPVFLLSIGRGCLYSCSFCGGNARAQYLLNHRQGIIVRSVASVLAAVKKAVSFGYSFFYSCFEFENSDTWYLSFFKQLKEEIPGLTYGYGCYALPSKALIDAVAETFSHVIFELSPESADPDLRQKNKDRRLYYTNHQLEECLDYIGTKPHLKVQLYFAYFLPFDTEETIIATLVFISRLFFKYWHFVEVIYGNLSTDPGSLLFLDPVSYGVELKVKCFKDYLEWLKDTYIRGKAGSAPDMTLFKPGHLTESQAGQWAAKIRLFGYLLYYFSGSLRHLFEQVGETAVLADYLKTFEMKTISEADLDIDALKDFFLEFCSEYVPIDAPLMKAVSEDYKAAPSLAVKIKANL